MNNEPFNTAYSHDLLFISYKFVKGFLLITSLLLVIFSWNFHNVCQRFLYNQEQNFSLIRQKTKIFSIDLWGNFSFFCRIHLKFCSWLYKKRWHTLWKFQLKITRNKQVIAKKPSTNLNEMNSTYYALAI